MEGVPAVGFEVPEDELRLSFFVRVGAAPVLLFVVVTAPLDDSALFNDLTKTVGSLESFIHHRTATCDNQKRAKTHASQQIGSELHVGRPDGLGVMTCVSV